MSPRAGVRRLALAAVLSVVTVLGTLTPAAAAEDASRQVTVRSFDGTGIVTYFFRAPGLRAGERRPVIMLGHGWAGRAETDPAGGMLGTLLGAGYNVVTWNARGFGSGGEANVDDPRVEGRDVQALIDWIARQPEVRLDRAGDPRLGMAGGSYGGGIQLVTAGLDRRVDAIAPTIAFNSLLNSLYPDEIFRSGWGLLLCSGGLQSGNRLSWQVTKGCVTGMASGTVPKDVADWFGAHGPDYLVERITAPTLLLQGTVDTLFPLREAIANYKTLAGNGVPVKMVWFCGGHGVCSTKPGPADHTTNATLTWFDKYLRNKPVDTGAGFEYIDQNGVYRTAPSYPPERQGTLRATGSGAMAFSRADALQYLDDGGEGGGPGGLPLPAVAALPATKAVNVHLPAPAASAQAVGTPQVTLRYRGLATKPRTFLFAQLVDRKTGVVVGNQATPIPVVLDGKPRTVTRTIEAISLAVDRGSDIDLQIVPITGLFDYQRAAGAVTLTADVTVPLAAGQPATD
ncbi:CocE/NonD family hydrolase [Spirillospora sp. NPDC047418]